MPSVILLALHRVVHSVDIHDKSPPFAVNSGTSACLYSATIVFAMVGRSPPSEVVEVSVRRVWRLAAARDDVSRPVSEVNETVSATDAFQHVRCWVGIGLDVGVMQRSHVVHIHRCAVVICNMS